MNLLGLCMAWDIGNLGRNMVKAVAPGLPPVILEGGGHLAMVTGMVAMIPFQHWILGRLLGFGKVWIDRRDHVGRNRQP